MPGIDFAAVRIRISMDEVLELLDFRPVRRVGTRVRGRCPFDCGSSPLAFVANLALRRYHCFSCHRSGNQLELWASLQRQPFHDAVYDLCQRLNIRPPRIEDR
jgi:DNA primase